MLLTNGGHTRELFEDLYGELFTELAGVSLPERFAPPAEPVEVNITPFVGRYERTSVEVEAGQDGLRMRTTVTGPLAALGPEPVEEHRLVPVGPALFAMKSPETEACSPVTFYELPTGERYVHFGVRATPRVEA